MSDYRLKRHPHQREHARVPLWMVHGICYSGQCREANYVPFFAARGHDVYTLSLARSWRQP